MKLLGLHGLPRSGKDTVAEFLVRHHGFTRLAFADPLKKAAAVLLNRSVADCQGENGFDREAVMPEWGFSMRWFLQMFGTECMRDVIAEDFWIRRAALEIDRRITRAVAWDEKVNIVFTDVRFPNEAEMIWSRGGVLINVVRPGVAGSSHASDQPIGCDIALLNDGSLHQLYEKTLSMIENLKSEDLTV